MKYENNAETKGYLYTFWKNAGTIFIILVVEDM